MEEATKRQITCCFTGHRMIAEGDKETLGQRTRAAAEELIREGVECFLCGGAIGFDTMAGQVIVGLRQEYPKVKLKMILPCKNQDAKWSAEEKAAYQELLKVADERIYVSEEDYFDGCMKARNIRLVEESGYCIAYMRKAVRSGTAQTVRLAKKQGLKIINLAEQ
ncbi:SLOG family protein [Candidatus Saccharibacteria bacterium]|nr:SLOG family protein [Candidatus Saccharibacteria bacterium]